jgi:hypothetical protein
MPYKDPEKRREAVRRHRVRRGLAIAPFTDEDAAAAPDPPSRDELLRVLGVQARAGNVAAIRLLLLEYRRQPEAVEDPFAEFVARNRR